MKLKEGDKVKIIGQIGQYTYEVVGLADEGKLAKLKGMQRIMVTKRLRKVV